MRFASQRNPADKYNVFRTRSLNRYIYRKERDATDGDDKSWVTKVMLSWNLHYKHKRLLRSKKIANRPNDRLFLKRYEALLKDEQTSS